MKNKLNPTSFQQIKRYLQYQPHAILLTGLSQAARNSVIDYIGNQVSDLDQIRSLVPEKTSISIAQVKAILPSLHRRSDRPEPLIVAIPEAHRLTLPAQNALLKLLEEPPLRVKFILAAPAPDSLLATIQSRSQHIRLHPLNESAFEGILPVSSDRIKQLYAVTGGDPFLAQELSNDVGGLKVVELSRRLLQEPLGQALLELTSELKQGANLDLLMAALRRIARLGLERASNHQDQLIWHSRLASVSKASENLKLQLNQKLTLDLLLLEFRAA